MGKIIAKLVLFLAISKTSYSDCCGSYSRQDCLAHDGKQVSLKGEYCGDCAQPSSGFGCCGAAGSPGGGHYGCNLFCCNCQCRPWCSNCPIANPPVGASRTGKAAQNPDRNATKAKVDNILATFDKDGDIRINFAEFASAFSKGGKGLGMNAADHFGLMDKNKDGMLEGKEIDQDYGK